MGFFRSILVMLASWFIQRSVVDDAVKDAIKVKDAQLELALNRPDRRKLLDKLRAGNFGTASKR